MSKRTARIIAIVLGIAVALAVLAWYLRDTLIREISNPLLQDYGVAVTDVSLDAIATRDASIAYLELSYEGDTVIAIEGLTLPIIGTTTGVKTYSARRVSIVLAGGDEQPADLASLVDRILSLSIELAGNEFRINELRLPPYPPIHDVLWALSAGAQDLQARVDMVSMSASIQTVSDKVHKLELSVPGDRITADLQRDESGFSLSGSSDLDLPSWSPLAKLAGIVPGEVHFDSGTGQLTLDVDMPFSATNPPTAQIELVPSSPWQLSYAHESGETTSVMLQAGDPIRIAAEFPAVDWTLRQASSTLQVSYDDWNDIPLVLADVFCRPGPECSLSANVNIENDLLPIGRVGEARLSALVDAVFADDAIELRVQPGALADVRRLESPDIGAVRIEGRLASPGTLEIVDAGWTLAVVSIDGHVTGLSVAEDLVISAPVFLENVALSELDDVSTAASGVFVPNVVANLQQLKIDLAGVKGALELRGGAMQAELVTVGLQQDGALQVQHDLQTGDGAMQLDDAVLSLGSTPLSGRISPWEEPWDLRDGTVSIGLAAEWQDSGDVLRGSATAGINDLSGFYEDSVIADVSTALELNYSSAGELSVAPATLRVGLLDVGVPITEISADYVLDPDGSRVAVDNLKMTAVGGEIRADPFSFRTGNERNTLLLHAESLKMDQLLTVREFEAIEVMGSISARLPVSIEGDAVTITNGTLSGEPPGGIIRYLPGAPPDESDASSLAFVRKVLSNFEYESLTSVVDYTGGGDLKLQLRLEGRNPDMDETRPVVLNLNVENNVPQMLRSLRAARAVEEVLEQRFQRQRGDAK